MVLLVAGCGDKGPSQLPAADAIEGKYRLIEESKNFLTRSKGYGNVDQSIITLHRDGTALISNLPDCYVDGFGRGHGRLLSGQGKWEIENTSEGYGITLSIFDGGTLAPGIYHGSSILIRGKNAPFDLQFGLGDPDQNESISYEKRSS